MNEMYLVLGDWSDSGHGKNEYILISSNKTIKEIQEAYKVSCELTGISFDHENEKYHDIITEYEDCYIPDIAFEIFKKHGLPEKFYEDRYLDSDTFVDLWFWFVGLSLPGLEFEVISEENKIPCINGYYSDINVQFGYGLYD